MPGHLPDDRSIEVQMNQSALSIARNKTLALEFRNASKYYLYINGKF